MGLLAEVKSYREEVEKQTMKNLEKAATKIGLQAERNAVTEITAMKAIDTGLLRNSITYAIGGNAPHKGSYHDNAGKKSGHYEGTTPKDEDGEITVYIGTNVEYGPYVEMGYRTSTGKHVAGRPFIKNAVMEHVDDYKKICEEELGKMK